MKVSMKDNIELYRKVDELTNLNTVSKKYYRDFKILNTDVRIFNENSKKILIYLHGGGFVSGNLNTHSNLCYKLSKELNLPILVLSQLSRKPEQRENHRPMITDFSESKVGINNYADIVLLLYRDEYYNSDTCKNNIAEIIIAKNPSRLGTIELAWMPEHLKFGNLLKIR